MGTAACGPLRRALLDLAAAWARAVAPDRPAPVVSPAELPEAVRAAFARWDGPLLVASADAPRLGPAHADMALSDLAAGADASFGPGMDGGWYLAALAAPHEALLDLLVEGIDGPEVMARTLAAASAAHLEVGLLRMERLLRSPQDAAALRADPLTPEPIRSALAGSG